MDKVIIQPPDWEHWTPEQLERVLAALDAYQRTPGAALVLPPGWTFEVVGADVPIVLELDGRSAT